MATIPLTITQIRLYQDVTGHWRYQPSAANEGVMGMEPSRPSDTYLEALSRMIEYLQAVRNIHEEDLRNGTDDSG